MAHLDIDKLGVGPGPLNIDWDITPDYTFTYFESWGSQRSIKSLMERYYYFFIDNWARPARVCLMERGVKYAKILAEIDAPQDMVDRCVLSQGKTSGLDKSYAIDELLKEWLIANVLDSDDGSKITRIEDKIERDEEDPGLPGKDSPLPEITSCKLDSLPREVIESDIPEIVKKHNFYDRKYNKEGRFDNYFVDNGDGLTVTDMVTSIMWQRGGFDIGSIRKMEAGIEQLNRDGFAGYSDWRLPTLEEALSLMEPDANSKEIRLHPCFSREQPFIFVANRRYPGGYWFADFKAGNVFWASGFNPGGFGRVCRTVT